MTDDAPPVTRIDVARALAHIWYRQHRRLLAILLGTTVIAWIMLAAGHRDSADGVMRSVVFYGMIAVGMLTMSGAVSEEYRSGLVSLWFQKPGSLVRTYLSRYAFHQGLVVATALIVSVCLFGPSVAVGDIAATRAVRICVAATAMATLTVSVVFAMSALNIKRDAMFGLIVVMGTLTLGAVMAFDEGPVADAVRAVAFPIDSIGAIAGGSAYPKGMTIAIITLAAHYLAWNLIAFAGLRFTSRNLTRAGQAVE